MGQLSAIIYGVGTVGQLTARLLLERGARIAGAIGHKSNVGRDIGEVIGWKEPLGVTISADAEHVLGTAKADIVILCVGETMEQTYPFIERCVLHGLDVLSLSEQVFYPWRCAPELARKLDELAKRHGVTVSAGGMQDVFFIGMPTTISAACQRISSFECSVAVNVDGFGPAVAKDHCLGEPGSAFRQMTPEERTRTNVLTISLEALAADLGLEVTGWTQQLRPLLAQAPIHSAALERTILPGQVSGAVTASRVTTREGIDLIGEMHLKVFEPPDTEIVRWIVHGEPTMQIECPRSAGYIATGTTIVNRLPDVLAAPPGLVTIERLPKPKFRVRLG